MRKKPEITPPESLTHQPLEIIEQTRKYALITPLYGGGVTPTEPDPITIVRATEVRGHLRFWWRVMRGWQAERASDLKTREDSIWGKAYEKGDKGLLPDQIVQIVVEPMSEGNPIEVFQVKNKVKKNGRSTKVSELNQAAEVPGYAAFPLQHTKKELAQVNPPKKIVRNQVKFCLTISYPRDKKEEIEAALWAWETFGGIGARTRRGFGALHLLEVEIVGEDKDKEISQKLPTSGNVEEWIRDEIHKYIKIDQIETDLQFPHLSSRIHLAVIRTSGTPTPAQAWNTLIKKLQDFRLQKDEHNRSAWPEADAIRRIVGKSTKNNPPSPQTFPRAAFGLPIIFHFTGDDAPEDSTLNEADRQSQQRDHKERFASPLILRPFLCSDNRAVGLALLLEGSRVDLENLVLQDENKKILLTNDIPRRIGKLTPPQARAIAQKSANSYDKKNSLRVLNDETDVLQAFMKFLKKG
jgi:CRISPR-associated protein Cmr1